MILTWDAIGERVYENGLEKGVLYLEDGSAVPWNGLISVNEEDQFDSNSVYYDGVKINELVSVSGVTGSIEAFTYPDEFLEVQGFYEDRPGVFYGNQAPQAFGLAYRTKIGNDVSEDLGYKLHVWHNVFATPTGLDYSTISDDPEVLRFSWDLSAVPEEIVGGRPSAHMVIDSRTVDPWLLQEIEAILYGTDLTNPSLPSLTDLFSMLSNWYRFKLTNNTEDGTVVLESEVDGVIEEASDGTVTLNDVRFVYADIEETILILFDTKDLSDIKKFEIIDNGDGSWIAYTPHDGYITIDPSGEWAIEHPSPNFLNDETYEISDIPY